MIDWCYRTSLCHTPVPQSLSEVAPAPVRIPLRTGVFLFYFVVGKLNCAPLRMPVGQRAVIVFRRV